MGQVSYICCRKSLNVGATPTILLNVHVDQRRVVRFKNENGIGSNPIMDTKFAGTTSGRLRGP